MWEGCDQSGRTENECEKIDQGNFVNQLRCWCDRHSFRRFPNNLAGHYNKHLIFLHNCLKSFESTQLEGNLQPSLLVQEIFVRIMKNS